MPFLKGATKVVMMLFSYTGCVSHLLANDLRCIADEYLRRAKYSCAKSHYRSHLARSVSCVCVGTPPYKGGVGNSHA